MRKWTFRDYMEYLAAALLVVAYFVESLLPVIGTVAIVGGLLFTEPGELLSWFWAALRQRQPTSRNTEPKPLPTAFSSISPGEHLPAYVRDPSRRRRVETARLAAPQLKEVPHH